MSIVTTKYRGKLIVFEGVDGAGKSSLCTQLATYLLKAGHPVVASSFPGCEEGTLGKLVYSLHHTPQSVGVTQAIVPASIQALHAAAHIDAIERKIVPALRAGSFVLLDRFWWSTQVYGLASGINRNLLNSIVGLARAAWEEIVPDSVFLVERESPDSQSAVLKDLYRKTAETEGRAYSVRSIDNTGTMESSFDQVLEHLPLLEGGRS